MANGKWQMANGKWQMANGKWQMANGKKTFRHVQSYVFIPQVSSLPTQPEFTTPWQMASSL